MSFAIRTSSAASSPAGASRKIVRWLWASEKPTSGRDSASRLSHIEKWLKLGLSKTAIAKLTGVSRVTLDAWLKDNQNTQ